ncbi:hypothetical protein ADN00_18900 [Ornatilinea apprima]|uniref:Phage minor structural protein GP20 n=1 Tax=Ornatilinea apprima TaxID=1134406 RepID=A0A0P6WMS6_9CHLR|nr:hypothetical protein [Ornatilinea apprima]KPL70112.1 hypothetical protein ADN00_18900 [Ornatilinea apprima]
MLSKRIFDFDADDGKSGGNTQEDNETFDAWLEKQDSSVKGLYESHVANLKSALESERTSRKDAERQLRELAVQAGKGSEAEKKLTEMADKLAEATRRATFYEKAPGAGVRNVVAAYKLAMADGIFDGDKVDFKKLQEAYPELFGENEPPPGNAGEGNEKIGLPKKGMNQFIRAAAGRK